MPEPRLISLKESLKLLNVNRKFFNDNIRPHLKEAKLGKHILFRESDIEDFINRMFNTQEVQSCEKENYRQDLGGEVRKFTSTQRVEIEKCEKQLGLMM